MTIDSSNFDPNNGDHVEYVMANSDAYSDQELAALHKMLDENIRQRSYTHFINYNITDVELVRELNNKLHHLDLCVQIAYGSKVNFLDTFRQVRLWDAMMYFSLYDKKIVIPPKSNKTKSEDYIGAYVKDPIVGKHSWVVSFDVNSLYPSIMRQWNISPDRHVSIEELKHRLEVLNLRDIPARTKYLHESQFVPRPWIDEVSDEDAPYVKFALEQVIQYLEDSTIDSMLDGIMNEFDNPLLLGSLKILSLCITPNGQAFRVDSNGFLPEILARLYEERKSAKNKETKAKKSAEIAKTPEEKHKFMQEAVQWGLQQNTRKINLNSCYGAFGNEHFRFFDVRQAEAVTSTGQLIIRYVANMVNRYLNSEFGTNKDYVLASDTDSIYVTLAPVVANMSVEDAVEYLNIYCDKDLQKVIDKAFEDIGTYFNTQDNVLAMKREAIAEHGIWTAKKRYLLWVHDNEGVRYSPPKLKTVGIEAVRSSTPKYARDVIKKALEYFICDNKEKFYELIEEAEHGYDTRPFEDIASPRSCNGLEEYAILPDGGFTTKTPIHVKGSLMYNKHLEDTGLTTRYAKIRNGEKIRFCYLKQHNPLRCNVIAAPNTLPPEWNMERFLDRSEQCQKTLLSPLEAVIRYANWSIRPVVTFDF